MRRPDGWPVTPRSMVGWQPDRHLQETPPVAVTTPLAPTAPAPPAAETVEIPVAPAEVRALEAVQRRIGQAARSSRRPAGMSLFGEHAAGWLALGLLGALADRPRRRDWLTATAGVAAAHGASIAVKRVVRRPRPDPPAGAGARRHAEPAQLPVRARHLDHRRRRAVRRPARPPARPGARPADGAVPAGPGRALPDRRRRGRPAGRRRRRRRRAGFSEGPRDDRHRGPPGPGRPGPHARSGSPAAC